MNKTATTAQNASTQALFQPKLAFSSPRSSNKGKYDAIFNLSMVYSFVKFSTPNPHLVTTNDIAETLQAAKELLRDPHCDHKKKLAVRALLFETFACICIATKDEEVRRKAEEARDSIPYPFELKYKQVQRP